MTFELLPLLGVEGIIIFSLILIVSLGLAGFRLSVAGATGQLENGQSVGSLLRVRQRLATRSAAPVQVPEQRSRLGAVPVIAGWILTAVRNSAAKTSANQSKIIRDRPALGRVKGAPAVEPVQSEDDSDFVDDGRAGVSGIEPKRMDSDTQWDRVNKIVTEGLGKAKEIETLHEAAARQLDAVDYAYERMLMELRDVLPGVVESRSICRTNRDDAYAAVTTDANEAAVTECAGPEAEIQDEAALANVNGYSGQPSARANRASERTVRQAKAAESAAA